MSSFFYFMQSCLGTGTATGRFPIQGILPKCLKGFIVSEVNSESEQARDRICKIYNYKMKSFISSVKKHSVI